MTDLDDSKLYSRLDPLGMSRHLINLPQECLKAWQKARDFPLPAGYRRVKKVVIAGMGGSAIAGDLVQSLAALESKEIFVHRDYELPFALDAQTLFIASSFSGNTEETLSSFDRALTTPAKKLVLTTGGKLLAKAQAASLPAFLIEYRSPPRAALAHSFFPLLALLQKAGVLRDKSRDVAETVSLLEKHLKKTGIEQPLASNPTKQLASQLLGKLPVIYGAGFLSPVARRWKGQINENSKAWSFYEVFPELNHNAVVGFQFPQDITKKIFVVLLFSPLLHPRIQKRYRITEELLKQAGIDFIRLTVEGESPLSQMMTLLYSGDWVSYYLAMLNGAGPSPNKTIDYLKEQMEEYPG